MNYKEAIKLNQQLLQKLNSLSTYCAQHNLLEFKQVIDGLIGVSKIDLSYYMMTWEQPREHLTNKHYDELIKVYLKTDSYMADLIKICRKHCSDNFDPDPFNIEQPLQPETVGFEHPITKN